MNVIYRDGQSPVQATLAGQVLTLSNGASRVAIDLAQRVSDVVELIDVFVDPAGELHLRSAFDRAYAAHVTIPALPAPEFDGSDLMDRPFFTPAPAAGQATRKADTDALVVEIRAVPAWLATAPHA